MNVKKTNYKSKIFKFAELFCGPGGLSLGAVLASRSNSKEGPQIQAIWANDYNEDTCKTYARNIHPHNPQAVYCGKVEELDFKVMPHFDALAFGFPCNDFSQVGKQKGFKGKFGPLYTYAVEAINIHNPDWFIAENVSGLRSANSGHAFAQILEDLEKAGKYGYELTPNLYSFEDYGVPQIRHRIIIIGIRKDIGLKFKVPAPTTKGKPVTVKEAIENPPIAIDALNNELTRQSDTVVERLNHIPPGKNAWYEGIPPHLQLNVKGARMSQIYKRLDPNKPSYTITGSGGGGTHVYHWSEPRALTNRERARIQTFPDDIVFIGSKESVRKQIGMAVPVQGAKVVVKAVLDTFAGIPYEFVESNVNMEEIKKKKTVPTQIATQLQ